MKHCIILLLSCIVTTNAHAALHKWVDEKGQVHYGDEIPPQYLQQKREELNESGMVVKSYNAAKTQEELAKEQQQKQASDQAKKEQVAEERKRVLRDRILLETYTTESDITILRDDRISAIDSQIQIAQSNLKEAEKKHDDINSRISKIEKTGKPVPENMRKDADNASKQIQSYKQYIDTQNTERTQTLQKFDGDLQRFRELKSAQQKNQ